MHDITYNLILFIASFLIWIMILCAIILWFFSKRRQHKVLVAIFFTILIAVFISQLIKSFFPYARPFELYNLSPITLTFPKDSSFPSTHAAVAFALAFSLNSYYKKYAFWFFICAMFVGIGRIVSNVHFLGDVAGGVLVGYLANKIRILLRIS
ncbi:MAG: phosphatase PAP2 family protein [Patescibacteria group bacterium]|nr:phosphatase PAP2 family protein [Patescibacteria group bacterium]